MGRPSSYTQELADRICEELAMGKSLRTVCKGDGMPTVKTIFNWMRTNEAFLQQYARAKEESADALYEEIIDIADNSSEVIEEVSDPKLANAAVTAHRLRVDTRKWMASKMKPKKYGDKIDVTTKGEKLPTPIMSDVVLGDDVQADDSNDETSQT